MTWTWPGMIAAVFILVFGFWGFHRGFIREVVATAFVILSLVLVYMLNPYVNSFLREHTPVESAIREKCDGFVKEKAQDIGNMGEAGQNTLLHNLGLPQLLTQQIKNNNSGKTYQEYAVTGFTEYVSSYLTNLLVNGISFLITYIFITILTQIILKIMDLISKLPIIDGINRMAGGLIGAGKAVVLLWIVMMVLTIFAGSELGKTGLELVADDFFLKFLYEQNVLIRLFL